MVGGPSLPCSDRTMPLPRPLTSHSEWPGGQRASSQKPRGGAQGLQVPSGKAHRERGVAVEGFSVETLQVVIAALREQALCSIFLEEVTHWARVWHSAP